MRPSAWRFQFLVAAVSAVLVLGVSGVLGTAVWVRSSAILAGHAGQSLGELSYQMADKLDRDMAMRVGEITLLAGLLGQDGEGGRPASPLLEGFSTAVPGTSWLGVLDASGNVVAATGGILTGSSIASRPVFVEGSKGLFVGDVHEAVLLAKLLANPTGEPLRFVDVAMPIQAPGGHVTGVLAAHFSWAWAREVEQSVLRPDGDRAAVEMFVVGADGVVLLGPDALSGSALDLAVLRDGATRGPGWTVATWPDGQRYLTGYAPSDGHHRFAGLGWTVLARKPLAVAQAPARALLWEILVIGGLMAAAFSAIGWVLARRTTRSLTAIAFTAERIRRGDFAAPFPEASRIQEVRTLGRSLRVLVEALTRKDRALADLQDLAHVDQVTGLPNRLHLERLTADMTLADPPCALLFLDLDGFKPINDRYGHQVGDAMLRLVGSRLGSCLRGQDFLSRVGGDEFLVILSSTPDLQTTAVEVAQRILAAISQPAVLEGHIVRVGCSIGISVWPRDDADIQACINLADAAMYRAKKSKTGWAATWQDESHARIMEHGTVP